MGFVASAGDKRVYFSPKQFGKFIELWLDDTSPSFIAPISRLPHDHESFD